MKRNLLALSVVSVPGPQAVVFSQSLYVMDVKL
jgi:hypothetical protein